jgi:hypothetical protein
MPLGTDDLPHSREPFEIKNWWDSIVAEESAFPAYAFLLVSPSDASLDGFLSESGKELEQWIGSNCLLLIFRDRKIQGIGFDPRLHSKASLGKNNKKINTAYFKELLKDRVGEGYKTRLAEYFKIPPAEFPSMVFFQGIFSLDHLSITLAGMNKKEIAQRLKGIFSVIQSAKSEKKPILNELKDLRSNPLFQKEGKPIISSGRNIAGKTFQIAIVLWIKSLLENLPGPKPGPAAGKRGSGKKA